MTGTLIRGLLGIGVTAAAALGFLQLGLGRPAASDETAARLVHVLDTTRGSGAVIDFGSSSAVATCTRSGPGAIRVRVAGTELIAAGPHVLETRSFDRLRELAVRPIPDLAAAELNLAGSHALYARQLGGLLQRRSVVLTPARFDGRAAYGIVLRASRPRVSIVVDRKTLEPVAAAYRSDDLTATSRLLPGRIARGC